MNKLKLIPLLALLLVGCNETKTVYIDSTTGAVVQPPPKVEPVKLMSHNHNLHDSFEIICLDGVQYYNGDYGWGRVLSPRIKVSPTGSMTGYQCDDTTEVIKI